MSINIVILDSNKLYVERLRRGLLNQNNQLTVTQLYDISSYISFYNHNEVEILLIEDGLLENNTLELPPVKVMMVLTEGNTSFLSSNQNLNLINKYQRISKIYRQLSEKLAELPNRVVVQTNDSDCKVISFYSPSGGSGTTLLTLAQAAKLAKNKKVLYLSLEDISSTEYVFGQTEAKGLSEIFSKLDISTLDLLKLRDEKTGIYYYPSFRNLKDLTVIEKSDIETFIELIRNSGLFDVVVVDMSNNLSELNSSLFELCDQLYVVVNDQSISWYKFDLMMKQSIFYRTVNEKGTLIINKGREMSNKQEVQGIKVSNCIEEYEFNNYDMLSTAIFIASHL